MPKEQSECILDYFLNRETGIPYGAGAYAVKYDMPVLYGRVEKLKRGHYRATYELITENPREMGAEAILEKYSQLLEAQILENPPIGCGRTGDGSEKEPVNTPNSGLDPYSFLQRNSLFFPGVNLLKLVILNDKHRGKHGIFESSSKTLTFPSLKTEGG
jgi:hypothetical protein